MTCRPTVEFNEMLELARFPSVPFRIAVARFMLQDIVVCFIIEHVCRRVFPS
jgi:hypothetical protein